MPIVRLQPAIPPELLCLPVFPQTSPASTPTINQCGPSCQPKRSFQKHSCVTATMPAALEKCCTISSMQPPGIRIFRIKRLRTLSHEHFIQIPVRLVFPEVDRGNMSKPTGGLSMQPTKNMVATTLSPIGLTTCFPPSMTNHSF